MDKKKGLAFKALYKKKGLAFKKKGLAFKKKGLEERTRRKALHSKPCTRCVRGDKASSKALQTSLLTPHIPCRECVCGERVCVKRESVCRERESVCVCTPHFSVQGSGTTCTC